MTARKGEMVLQLLRVHQYAKNFFIFAPMFFSFAFGRENILNTAVAFALFSLLASAVYIFNDIKDSKEDRKHPVKKHRPIASGRVKLSTAYIYFALLSFGALLFAYFFNTGLFGVMLVYFALNILYTLILKHISIIDINIIAAGFVLRLFAGSAVTHIALSMWIIILTFLLALFLAIAKRRDDVIFSAGGGALQTRKNIDGYNLEFINAAMVFMAGVIVVAYILYSVSQEVVAHFLTDKLYLTTFFVILGIMRYMQLVFVVQEGSDPTKLLYKDLFLKLAIAGWIASFFVVGHLL